MISQDAARSILDPVRYIPLRSLLSIIIPLLMACIMILILSERYRMIHAGAMQRLRRLKLSERLLRGSDEYDITRVELASKQDMNDAKKAVRCLTLAGCISIVTCTVILLTSLTLLSVYNTIQTARNHGYRDDLDVTAQALWDDIDASPAESTLPPDLTGCIVMYYKFGCDDCNALNIQLTETLSALAPVYHIATRSDTGQALIELYPVEAVPACIYFKQDGSVLSYVLYDSENGVAQIDQTAIASLSKAVTYDKTLRQNVANENEV